MHTTSADFFIAEKVGDRYFEGDTVNGINLERFTAKYPADSFVWTLGAETIRGHSFSRYAFPPGQWVQVKCIAYKNPNLSCFPDDKPSDTVVKKFYVWPVIYSVPDSKPLGPFYPIYGGFRGHTISKPNTEIVVRLHDSFEIVPPVPGYFNDSTKWDVEFIRNIPYNGVASDHVWPLSNDNFIDFSPKAIQINAPGAGGLKGRESFGIFPAMKGYAYLSRDWKSITIEYSYQDTLTQKWINDTFTGSKLW